MSDLTVEVVSFSYQFSLQCSGDVRFTFGSTFTLTDSSGASHSIDPAAVPGECAAALVGLVHQSVTGWTIDQDSTTLELRISNGASIRGSADPDYEAWEVHTKTGELIVALPGGSTAHFPPSG